MQLLMQYGKQMQQYNLKETSKSIRYESFVAIREKNMCMQTLNTHCSRHRIKANKWVRDVGLERRRVRQIL